MEGSHDGFNLLKVITITLNSDDDNIIFIVEHSWIINKLVLRFGCYEVGQ